MRRIWARSLGGGLLAGALATTAMLSLDAQDSPPAVGATVLAPAGADDADRDGKRGLGPPPWANARSGVGAERDKATDSWKDEWHALSPAQKAERMRSLARAHEGGIRKWTRCLRMAGADPEKRRACEKPLPPGLAKKQPRQLR